MTWSEGSPPQEVRLPQRSEASIQVVFVSGDLGRKPRRPREQCVRKSWDLLKDRREEELHG